MERHRLKEEDPTDPERVSNSALIENKKEDIKVAREDLARADKEHRQRESEILRHWNDLMNFHTYLFPC